VDNLSSSETAPSSSSSSVDEPISSSSIEPSSSSVLPSSYSVATYTVKYEANGGAGAPYGQEKIHDILLTLNGSTPTRAGYTFVSWNTMADGNGTPYHSGASYTGKASLTLYAQWKANTYAVKYDANGGIGAPPSQEKIHNISLTLSGAEPIKSGYKFVAWNTTANSNGTSYAPNANYTTNASVTLYACWKANTYTVKYDANGGNIVVPPDQEKIHDIPLTLNSTQPKTGQGYEFISWNTAANGSGTPYLPGAIYPGNASVTLYAQWRCKADVGPSINYVGENYNSVVICGQIWMARNLNYSVDGSKCYKGDNSNCAIYGRLYNWATAMALPSSCNSGFCASQVSTKHKGICPPGWHIPSKDEWSTLVSNVERSKGCTSCAAKHLKAASGWDDCSASGASITSLNSKSCIDSYGFSALPGGGISGGGNFMGKTIEMDGNWWSSTERSGDNGKKAYHRYAHNSYEHLNEGLSGDGDDKVNLFSVRCLKD